MVEFARQGRRGRVRELEQLVEERSEQLDVASHALKRLAALDSVTSIGNHNQFQNFLRGEWRRALREASSLSVIMIDIDHFKEYNDQLGYEAGDKCLAQVAGAINGSVHRPGDLVTRYGGQEFGVVLSRTGEGGALHLASRLRAAVEDLSILHPASSVSKSVTVSLGVATVIPARRSTWEELSLVAAARRAVSEAKHAGRNRVVSSPLTD